MATMTLTGSSSGHSLCFTEPTKAVSLKKTELGFITSQLNGLKISSDNFFVAPKPILSPSHLVVQPVAQDTRQRELKSFDDMKTGVKGLVDTGILDIPQIFVNSSKPSFKSVNSEIDNSEYSIPVIDLQGILEGDEKSRLLIVDQMRHACEHWGFFQVINHGISNSTLDATLESVRKFHEQDSEVKKEFYGRGPGKRVMFTSNYTLFTAAVADWRDSLVCIMAPHPPEPEELPQICRNEISDYSFRVVTLGNILLELMSISLGLDPKHLINMGCGEGVVTWGHYYPQCPQPHLTLGASKHTDPDFLTILLQDQVSGLQVLHQDKWVDVPPVNGALVINLGDLMQLITNDKFKSVYHRVLARDTGPRVSIACFLRPQVGLSGDSRVYGPLNELLSEEEAPLYKNLTIKEFDDHHYTKGVNGVSAIERYKL